MYSSLFNSESGNAMMRPEKKKTRDLGRTIGEKNIYLDDRF